MESQHTRVAIHLDERRVDCPANRVTLSEHGVYTVSEDTGRTHLYPWHRVRQITWPFIDDRMET